MPFLRVKAQQLFDNATASSYVLEVVLRSRLTTNGAKLKIATAAQFHCDVDAFISCEDNLKFMRRLPNDSMKLIVTSPPYNLGKEYEEKRSLDRYIEEQVACVAETVRLLHPNGSICWQVGNHVQNGEIFPLDIILYPIFRNAGLQLRNRIVWTFGHGLHCQKRFSGRHETILWFMKTDNYTFNLDPVRIPSKYPGKKHFKGPNKGMFSSNPVGKNPADISRLGQHDWEACLWKN
jgi:adenine-specific DNA-methyltransferase